MARQKPSFSSFKSLFDGMLYTVDETNFNVNSTIDIMCSVGHTYTTSITKIKNLNHQYKNCPHCKKESGYNEKRISIDQINILLTTTNYEIVNKKDFYSKWGDELVLKCKHDGYIYKIKSLNHWYEHGKKMPICPECSKVKTLPKDKFDEKIQNIIKVDNNIILQFPSPIFNKLLTENVSTFIKNNGWVVKEYNGTRKKSIFLCGICGYEKESNVYNLRSCNNCLKYKMKSGVNDKLYNICKSSNIFIEDGSYKDINTPIKFQCNSCNFKFTNTWAEITGKYYRLHCPECYASTKRKTQNEIYNYIKSIISDDILTDCKSVISPKELDIYIPSKNIAFEYCGNIWHSEKFISDNNYHYNKMRSCIKNNIMLITIFEDEWVITNDICRSRIKSILGIYDYKIFAKTCVSKILDTDTAKRFLNENHFQGTTQFDICYGLYDNNELMSVMAFKNVDNSSKQHNWELVRFSNKLNTLVVGGASKLLKLFVDCHTGTLATFSDSRWGNGTFYEKIGFKFEYDIPPSYYYVGNHTQWRMKHRFTYNKQRMVELFKEDPVKTEHEMATNNGLYRLYDCGHKKFIMYLKSNIKNI